MTVKVCVACRQEQPRENYHKNRAAKDGLQSRCKACTRKYSQQNREENRQKNASTAPPAGARLCGGCRVEKPFSEFYVAPARADGYTTRCRECTRNQNNSNRHAREHSQPMRYLAVVDNMFECRRCKVEKDMSNFYKNRRQSHGYDTLCKPCRLALNKEFYRGNPDYFKNRYGADPKFREGHIVKSQRRRAMKFGAMVDGFSEPTALNLERFYGKACLFPGCDSPIPTVDHVIPLSKGGTHTYFNAQPLCINHNSQKRVSTTDYRLGHPYGTLIDSIKT